MPRRNSRDRSVFKPLDLTIPDEPRQLGRRPQTSDPYRATEDPYLKRMRLERERAERQAEARRKNGIDWSACIVPGCGEDIRLFGVTEVKAEDRDPERVLPFCIHHEVIVWRQVQNRRGDPLVIKTSREIDAEERRRFECEEAELQAARKADRNGHMYFVRINELIKVGWTRDLGRRLKEYGAGAVILCHYPATMDDEVTLHQQLRPSLARGREWYRDDELVAMFMRDAIKRHGGPTARADWSEPKADLDARSRRRR